MNILVLHGPNLNLLGLREPEVYGRTTLNDINARLNALAAERGAMLRILQSNHEGVLIDAVQEARTTANGILINPGGYTHTSVAIHDALRSVSIPAIEVHLSNLYARESLRHTSVTGVACAGVIMGLGTASYLLALRHLASVLASVLASASVLAPPSSQSRTS